MDHLSETASWQEITKKIVLYCFPLLFIYAIFTFISNEMVYHNHHFPSIQLFCKSRSFRFIYREFEIYTFGYLGYRFLKNNTSVQWSKLFVLVLVFGDLFISSIGAYRYFVGDSPALDILYNQILVFFASPFYFMLFSIFVLYLRPGKAIDKA